MNYEELVLHPPRQVPWGFGLMCDVGWWLDWTANHKSYKLMSGQAFNHKLDALMGVQDCVVN